MLNNNKSHLFKWSEAFLLFEQKMVGELYLELLSGNIFKAERERYLTSKGIKVIVVDMNVELISHKPVKLWGRLEERNGLHMHLLVYSCSKIYHCEFFILFLKYFALCNH